MDGDPPEGLDALLEACGAESDPKRRRNLAELLEKLPSCRPEALLVGLLSDAEREVREAAVESLFSLTGDDFGYEPDAPQEERRAAVRRWESWLSNR